MRTALAIVSAFALLGGCAERPPVVHTPVSAVKTPVIGGTATQRRLVREALAGLTTRFDGVELNPPARRVRPAIKGDVQMVVLTSSTDLRTEWESWLLAGAFNQLAYDHGVRGAIWLDGPGGGGRLGSWTPPNKVVPHGPPRRGGDARKLSATIRDAAARARVAHEDFEILQPYGLAPFIKLRASDPAAFLRYRLDTFAHALDRSGTYEGTYLLVVDEEGEYVWSSAGASRCCGGAAGIRPDLAGCRMVSLSTPVEAPPPPRCPA
jgi:hypothetical protein